MNLSPDDTSACQHLQLADIRLGDAPDRVFLSFYTAKKAIALVLRAGRTVVHGGSIPFISPLRSIITSKLEDNFC